ncbi:MAG: ABC transporter ATP-binding protein, partial [Clostridia bacterium]|nr:ABC transporter ATP-binding protein [Clostridia bacterium]
SLFAAKFITSRTRRYFKEQSEAAGAETAFLNETVSHQKTVKAFGRERAQTEAFDALNRRLHTSSLRAVFFSSLTNPSTRFVNSLVYAAVALIGALLCLSGTPGLTGTALTVGGLTALLSYANQYMKPFNEISAVMAETQNALVCAGRLFEFLDEPEESPDVSAESNPDPERKGTVAFDSVSFSYDPDRPLIQNLTLEFPPGCRAAIVGPTGCGKTTLINLLMRFYDVNAGAVRVDGTDVREMRRGDLRARYGMVLQDTWLKRGTVRENLLLGRPDATEYEMIAAAEAAHADSFIRVLPDGYDTFLEENGGSLSQGQKQLLCIARVFLCRPPMLILDEATSSIDSRTELRIQSAFSRLTEGRTSFIVAHRLSTVRSSDVILVMRDGTVVERGTHGELLEKNGFYAGLYRSQFEIPED